VGVEEKVCSKVQDLIKQKIGIKKTNNRAVNLAFISMLQYFKVNGYHDVRIDIFIFSMQQR
jgi:hypothetical protein